MENKYCLDEAYSTTQTLYKREDMKEKNINIKNGGLRLKGFYKQSKKNAPLISIVTVVYNGEKYIEDTIRSVISQTYNNVEYIIIDGGSTDKTIDIVKKYGDKIDYWISERDKGIYDGMNKGITHANGDLIAFINADDWYKEGIFEKVINTYKANTNYNNIISGQLCIVNNNKDLLLLKDSCHQDLVDRMSINHPTVFVERTLYEKRKYNSCFKISGDFDLFLFMFRNREKLNIKFTDVNQIFSYMREDGVSDNFKNIIKVIREDFRARTLNLKKAIAIKYLIRDILFKLPKKLIKYVLKNFGLEMHRRKKYCKII